MKLNLVHGLYSGCPPVVRRCSVILLIVPVISERAVLNGRGLGKGLLAL
jgi:hypothetical protein